MSQFIVLLGGNELNGGMVSLARRLGAGLLVVDWNEAPATRGEKHFRIDIKDDGAVLNALRPYLSRVLFAYTSADVATGTVAAIHGAIGLRTCELSALANARDKPAMNRLWATAGLLGKQYRLCRRPEEIRSFLAEQPAVIVKPGSSSGSRGITVIDRQDAANFALFELAWNRAADQDPDRVALVEQYVEGTEFTVEMLGDDSSHVGVRSVSRKYHTSNSGRNRVATKLHYNAPDVDLAKQQRIAEFGAACFRALGLRNSLGHFEVIERSDGSLVPVEMAARSSGFIFSHLVDGTTADGVTFAEAYLAVLRGGQVANELVTQRDSAMYFFYDIPPGVGTRDDLDITKFLDPRIRSLAFDRSRLRSGRTFGQIDGDGERYGFEILVGPRGSLTYEAVAAAESNFLASFLEA